ncbi:MAG: DUF1295 domain-containing protein [Bdellovibrionales bacterium]|nr:DUF1295 domain-containing protein [Bdellovibrionales bacterium]
MVLRPVDFTWLILGPLIFSAMTLLWARQLKTKNATSVDLAWSVGTGLTTWILVLVSEGVMDRRTWIAMIVTAWSVRLALLLFRRVRSGVEDGRYQDLRRNWKPKNFLFFYWGQGALIWFLPLVHLGSLEGIQSFPSAWDLIFIALWLFGFVGEWMADHQLEVFRRENRGAKEICRVGWWNRCRHPNYFFESLQWISWGMISLFAGLSSDRPVLAAALAILCPTLVVLSIFRVTGIPATEEHMLETRGDAYRDYMKEVPAFFPRFRPRA